MCRLEVGKIWYDVSGAALCEKLDILRFRPAMQNPFPSLFVK